QEFVDHYEVLEISPNASFDTVERVFRYLAKKHHPDLATHSDPHHFTKLVEAFETLRDPRLRAAYDRAYERKKQARAELVRGTDAVSDDCSERYKLP
ncbi:MAG: J domain-containing protein, partial [Novipirellula sp. JB048]